MTSLEDKLIETETCHNETTLAAESMLYGTIHTRFASMNLKESILLKSSTLNTTWYIFL